MNLYGDSIYDFMYMGKKELAIIKRIRTNRKKNLTRISNKINPFFSLPDYDAALDNFETDKALERKYEN